MTARVWILGNLTIDDVVLPDGSTSFGLCGGNALYAARGARAWEDSVGVAARIGPDFPRQHVTELGALGLELDLIEVDHPTMHNWALYESADVRQFILWSGSGTHDQQSVRAAELSPAVVSADACHVAAMPLPIQKEIVMALRGRTSVLALDPHEDYIAGCEADLLALLPAVTLFLPSRREASLLFGRDDPEAAALAFRAAGSEVVAVKMGSEGSIVSMGSGPTRHVPAVAVRTVDPTGAGDAYCGGFVAAYVVGGDPLSAACHGTVSASLVVETRGAPTLASRDRESARERLDGLMEQVGAAAA